MALKAKRHVHKYRKVSTGFGLVWACALPDCSHYMPQVMTELISGKFSICWGCRETFVLTPENMKDDFPRCDDCKGGNAVTEALSEIEKRFLETGKAS